jgi:hypothetical protein
MPIVKCKICGKEEVRSMRREDARCFSCKILMRKEYYKKNKGRILKAKRLRKTLKSNIIIK